MSRENLYKSAVILLNALNIILVVIYGIHFKYTNSIPVLEFAWGCVGIALTIFVDTTQNRILKLINQRPIALFSILGLLIFMMINIILSIF